MALSDWIDEALGLLGRAWQRVEEFFRDLFGLSADLLPYPAVDAELMLDEQPAIEPQPIPAELPIDDTEETALARMLASEDRAKEAKVVIGWITVQKARARRTSLYQVLTRGQGYGPQDRRSKGGGIMYASTAKAPRDADRRLARGLIDGTIQPSAQILAHRPGAWVERGQGVSDDKLIAKQQSWNEGIYGRVAGTRWMLYSSDSPKIAVAPGSSASRTLDEVPIVPAVDDGALEGAA